MVSLGGLARKVFGSSNDRRVKSTRPRVEAINAMENEMRALSDAELAGRTEKFRQDIANGATPRRSSGAGLRHRARSGPPRARHAAFRRPADRRHGAAQWRHRRDAHRRGQDPGRDAAGLSQRARRQRRPRRHRQRLSRHARLRMDGPRLQVPRPLGRRHRPRPVRRGTQRRLRRRRHLRHQQRARLRLSARQHEIRARPDGAARPQLRDRRRGRFHPGRRGAHAADHFRSARGPFGNVQHHRHLHHPAAAAGL